MKTSDLLKHIDEIERITDLEWIHSLDDRKKKELEFHDKHRDLKSNEVISKDTFDELYGNKKFYKTVKLSNDYVLGWIKKNAKDKIFLDYACGNGSNALYAAESGANLSLGLDISKISVENSKNEAQAKNLKNTRFFQADAENTKLPDNSVDTIICSDMLHHLDLSYALPELRRILKPGGKILAVEALDYNPAIKLYRYLTPDMRTEWEKAHILSLKDIKFTRRFFEVDNIKFWHVTSYAGAFFPKILPFLNRLDQFITKIPLIRLMAWIFTFELKKPGN
jgi:ubiquinone/menaquinone biosynthesis C-methylase UbiE